MERVITADIPTGHYEADAVIFWCVDDRFGGAYKRMGQGVRLLDEFIGQKSFSRVDLFMVAGGAKGFADEDGSLDKNFLFSQLEKSIKLHKPKVVILMVHSDCGAYGKKFDSLAAEKEFFRGELNKSEEAVEKFLSEKGINMPIEKYFAHFGGLDRVY